mgnify:CR=1 FL=1
MRGTVAKQIRKQIYRDQSIKQRRYLNEVISIDIPTGKLDKNNKPIFMTIDKITRVNSGLRKKYLDAKRKRGGKRVSGM